MSYLKDRVLREKNNIKRLKIFRKQYAQRPEYFLRETLRLIKK